MNFKKTNKSRLFGRVISMLMVLCFVCGTAIFANAAGENESVMFAREGVVQIQLWFNDTKTLREFYLKAGTGFLINENTVVTCQHVVDGFDNETYREWAKMVNAEFGTKYTAGDIEEEMEIRVSVYRDVYVLATIKKASYEMDYAVLTLKENIVNRTSLKLRDSSTLVQTEEVYALGFPGDMEAVQVNGVQYYEPTDVTITSGRVNKMGESDYFTDSRYLKGVRVVESSATIASGNSGGPLIDADGSVVGINAHADGTRNLAVASKNLIDVLDALGITYVSADAPDFVIDETSTAAPVATTVPQDITQDAVAQPKDDIDTPADDTTSSIDSLAIIGVIALLVIIAAAVIIVVLSKKKKAPVASTTPVAPVAPVTPAAPVSPSTPVSAETTVLNQGAGETTVLAQNINGGTLLRVSNNERIPVCSAEFTVGRERTAVDYCVGGNTNISRVHARFVVRAGDTYIVDNNAANGTFVNGVKARAGQEIKLKSGDKILLADEKFEFNK